MKKFLFIFILFTLIPLSVQGGVLTIENEPPELIKIRKSYTKQKKATTTPSQYKKLQQQYERDTEKSLNSPTFVRQKNVLKASEAQELQKIEKKYQVRQEKLKSNALKMVDRKYKILLEKHKQRSQKQIQSQYIVSLKRLEDKFIRQGDLANALVVQTERKKAMHNSESTIAGISQKKAAPKVAKAKAPAPKAPAKKTVAKKPIVKKAAPAPVVAKKPKASSSVPKTYNSDKKGFAGSGQNNKNNSYSFVVSPTKKGAELFFNAYGRKSNDSYGEVYIITPAGVKHQVSNWSPAQLKKSSYLDVTEAKHVVPITADVSDYVAQAGKYTVEFEYRDGNQALIIYKVGIKTL